MPSFLTDTPEQLKVEWISAVKTDLVAIVGDRTKILYEGPDKVEAKAVYDETKKHFEDRATERAKNTPNEDFESKVEFKPRKKAKF